LSKYRATYFYSYFSVAKGHAEEILRNLLCKRLVYVENDMVFAWHFNHSKTEEAEISDDNVTYQDCNFESKPQSTQKKAENE